MLNVLMNAVEAMDARGSLEVRVVARDGGAVFEVRIPES